ncbi:hypothetical protein [Spiroplasma endosymbiont of Nebria brevicollis]|uniref:hypothetical protein n=1 Tax=Spiroplasma endosymbiont of Nebria brevicollis TaxID=3066284 RepID=UPI00313E9643
MSLRRKKLFINLLKSVFWLPADLELSKNQASPWVVDLKIAVVADSGYTSWVGNPKSVKCGDFTIDGGLTLSGPQGYNTNW